MSPRTISAGFLAMETVALIQLTSASAIDQSLMAAVYAFSLSIPCVAGAFAILELELDYVSVRTFDPALYLFIAGSLLGMFGVGAMFNHFNPIAMWIFAVASIVIFVATMDRLPKRKDQKAEKS